MKIMVGIALHSNNALCGLMDQSGHRLLHQKLPCDLSAILELLQPYKDRIATLAVESTFNWYWLVDGLQDHGYHVVLANPARMKPYDALVVALESSPPVKPAIALKVGDPGAMPAPTAAVSSAPE